MRLSSSFYPVASTKSQMSSLPKFGMAITETKPNEYARFTYLIAPSGQTFLTIHRADSTFRGPDGAKYSTVQWNPERIVPKQQCNHPSLRTPDNYMLLVELASLINRINAIGIGESQQHYVKGNIPEGWAADRAELKRGDKPGEWHTALNQTIELLQSGNNQYELLFRFNDREQSEELVGFSFVETLAPQSRQAAPQKELHAIYLHPDVRRQGLGARLLKSMIAKARQEGCERIILDVGPGNKDASSLYKAVGFRVYQELAPIPWGDKHLLLTQMELTRDQFDAAQVACQRIIDAKCRLYLR